LLNAGFKTQHPPQGLLAFYKADDFCLGFHIKKGSIMSKEKKKTDHCGGVNMFLPGSGYLYVDNDCNRFIKKLVWGVLLIAMMITLSNAIQHIRGYSLPQGLDTGSLLLIMLVPLFLIGWKTAHLHNNMVDDTVQYNARRTASQGSEDARFAKVQKMRDEGLIPEQEFQKKKKDLSQ
jgi:hypothetical protein